MGLGLGFGAFVQGASEGYDKGRQRAIQDERAGWEREDHDEKVKARNALTETQAKIAGIREAVANGKAPFELSEDARNAAPAEQQSDATQPAQPEAQPRQAISVNSPTPAPAPAPAPTGQQQNQQKDWLMGDGTGRYKNQHEVNNWMWNGIKDAYGSYLEKTGQFDKRMELDDKINKWRDSAYDPLRKATGVAIMGGDPGAMKMLSHFSDVADIGIKVDPNSGTYDSKTQTWKGIQMTGSDGKKHTQDISSAQLTMLLSSLTPEKRAELAIDQLNKEKTLAVQDKSATAAMITAGAHAQNARTNESVRQSNENINNEVRTRNYFENSFAAGKDFMPKEPKELGMNPEQDKVYATKMAQFEANQHNARLASSIYSLNPGVKPGEITAFVSKLNKNPGMKPDGQDANGAYYFNVGGKKVVMPSN